MGEVSKIEADARILPGQKHGEKVRERSTDGNIRMVPMCQRLARPVAPGVRSPKTVRVEDQK